MNGVLAVVNKGGQYQIVLGDKVNDVYDEFVALMGGESGAAAATPQKKKRGVKNFSAALLDITTSIFSPTIGALAAGGMLKGILVALTALNLMSSASGTYKILYSAANAIFYFYPVLLGYTSGKRFGLDPFVGMAIGAAFVYPDMISAMGGETMYTLFSGTLFESSITMEFWGFRSF